MKRHLLSAADLTRDDALLVLDTAEELARVADRPIKKLPTLRGPHRRQPLLRGLHPHPALVRGGREAAVRGRHQLLGEGVERLEGREPQGHRAHARGDGCRRGRDPPPGQRRTAPAGPVGPRQRRQRRRRHARAPHAGAARRVHDAPADRAGSTACNVAIVGDVLHSRVARSNVLLLDTLGADVTLVAPPTLLPVGVDTWPCAVSYDLDAVLPKSDVVMMLRVQRERMNAAFFPTPASTPAATASTRRGWRRCPTTRSSCIRGR